MLAQESVLFLVSMSIFVCHWRVVIQVLPKRLVSWRVFGEKNGRLILLFGRLQREEDVVGTRSDF